MRSSGRFVLCSRRSKRQREVGLQVPFVELVQHHRAHAFQLGIATSSAA